MGRLFQTLLLSFSLIGMFSGLASAQESEPVEDTEISTSGRPIEQITVTAQRTLFSMRREIVETEDEIFAFFNANNSSKKMDILCNRRAKTGTYIPSRGCEPRFMQTRRQRNAMGFLQGTDTLYSEIDLQADSGQDFENLENEIFALMAANKEFARKFADLAIMSEDYLAHRKAMFAKD